MEGRRSFIGRLFDLFGGVLAVIGSVGLFILVGLTVTDVFWRYALNDPIFGMTDISTMLSAIVVACAVAWAALKKAHVTIELIEGHLPGHILRPLGRLIELMSGALFFTASYALTKKSTCGFDCGNITDNLAIVHSPFYLALAASMVFCGALNFWSALRHHPSTSEES